MCPSSLFFGLTNIIQYLSVQLSLSILGGLDPDSPRIPKPMGAKVPQLFPISMDSASADMMADCVFIEKHRCINGPMQFEAVLFKSRWCNFNKVYGEVSA